MAFAEVIVATMCPHCGVWNDAHAGNGLIYPGDYSVCANCKQPAVFDRDQNSQLYVRMPTDEERHAMDEDPTLKRTVAALKESYNAREAIELLHSGGDSELPLAG